jgi:photosystem II stability/assembly factor-like uncharacterized protein
MIGMSCDEARLTMQDALAHDRHGSGLEAHLVECPDCRAFLARQDTFDQVVTQALVSATENRSVRAAVQRRLRQPAERRRKFHAPRRRLLTLALPLAVAAVLLAVAVPQFSSRLRPAETHGQGFREVRADIGYPMTIDGQHPNHLLAGDAGRLYQSWNAGASWRALGPFPGSFAVLEVSIDRAEPTRYIVATQHSILVSTDAGMHWRVTRSSLPGARNMFLTQDPLHPGTIYVGPSIVWKSIDHGETWAPAGPGYVFAPDGVQALAASKTGTLYTGIWNGGVAVSRDGGRSWQRRSRGLMPKVMDVAVSGPALWAATQGGVYESQDNGLHWTRRSPHDTFSVTSVVANGDSVLVAGDGAVYRSVDGGRHWTLGMDGLPPAPYVYSLQVDPSNAQRIYASLNTDGVFRSDDGGQTWTAANRGLPIVLAQGNQHHILFLRHGVVWQAPPSGADPGNLTVDEDVQTAALSPDEGSVAYVSGTTSDWSVRILSAYGSEAKTVIRGQGQVPKRILWSPDATRLAVPAAGTVYVSTVSGPTRTWILAPGSRLVAWNATRGGLWAWDSAKHSLGTLAWDTGQPEAVGPVQLPSKPSFARDGVRVALIDRMHQSLQIGPLASHRGSVPLAVPNCKVGPWSEDGMRVLVLCKTGTYLLSPASRITRVPITGAVRWMPGSHTDLLAFRAGNLWVWRSGKLSLLVHDAQAPSSTSG